jgi:hypothetical protein
MKEQSSIQPDPVSRFVSRRTFLGSSFAGLGSIALASLFGQRALAQQAESKGVVNPRPHPARAKRVIFLYQAGGPSHLETFDYKPKLAEMHGKPMPESFTKGQQIAQLQGAKLVCFGPQHQFKRFGQSGQEICEHFPEIGSVADDICIVRSMWGEQINHDPAHTLMNPGAIITGRPSMGSWILYALGADEMAARLQTSVPDLTEMSQEPQQILEMYGAKPGDGSFASNCLLARRLAERGVRFIQLYHRDWDHHTGIPQNIPLKAQEVDRATAALIRDLKQRGMLDDTLIIWGGEFGRTPMSQGGKGRDHHIKGFSYLLAGGGIKGGVTWGATDDLGYAAVENPVSVHDLHATMLHLLGLNHLRLTVKFQGIDARLTNVSGEVVRGILA